MSCFSTFVFCVITGLLALVGGSGAMAQPASGPSPASLATAPTIGYSGLPVPRFVNLKATETWGRVGPSFDYPVRFIFRRRGLPVRVIAETRDDNWRKVADPDGATMWIHRSQLISSADVLINRDDGTVLLAQPHANARSRARLQKGVLAQLETCKTGWCQVRVENYRGWVPKNALWGVN